MCELNLVTGANGHLGNNLVRALLNDGRQVRASVRDLANRAPFQGLDCQVVQADLLDEATLMPALAGVDTLYQVAAVFRHWARDPQKEIIELNMQITLNILQAAAKQGVRRVVYVSSEGALDETVSPVNETHWKTEFRGNAYWQSKTEAEFLALQTAEQMELDLVSVLPGAIIGPHCFRLTPTMLYLQQVLNGEVFVDLNFHLNFVDARDVAAGMIAAAHQGRPGERYLLATRAPVSNRRVIELAREFNPEVKVPGKAPKALLTAIAAFMELGGSITGIEPKLVRSQVEILYGTSREMDISKAQNELDFEPRDPESAIRESFEYLMNWEDSSKS